VHRVKVRRLRLTAKSGHGWRARRKGGGGRGFASQREGPACESWEGGMLAKEQRGAGARWVGKRSETPGTGSKGRGHTSILL